MHTEILSLEQQELLPLISLFKRSFYLVGGTAIALQLGHRRSIDFDLFSYSKLNRNIIKQRIYASPFLKEARGEDIDQLHFYVNDVKMTFFNYPYPVEHSVMWNKIISMPSLLDLAAMKAYALGRRSKWKDYVDLYFLLILFSADEIARQAKSIFGDMFSVKLFVQQLAFHKDIDYTEEVEYIIANPPTEEEIKTKLIDIATNIL